MIRPIQAVRFYPNESSPTKWFARIHEAEWYSVAVIGLKLAAFTFKKVKLGYFTIEFPTYFICRVSFNFKGRMWIISL